MMCRGGYIASHMCTFSPSSLMCPCCPSPITFTLSHQNLRRKNCTLHEYIYQSWSVGKIASVKSSPFYPPPQSSLPNLPFMTLNFLCIEWTDIIQSDIFGVLIKFSSYSKNRQFSLLRLPSPLSVTKNLNKFSLFHLLVSQFPNFWGLFKFTTNKKNIIFWISGFFGCLNFCIANYETRWPRLIKIDFSSS